ncbi:glycosyltransferase [Enterovibrio norvegicus]|uniref:Glycosyltransferase involved in cell wall bisynthesis n=1 Tax=Enterovibrio norvegicus DSM 15893 TaxID=1121869 RepID=A0A1I5N9I1_9GAMM|nr:glycosyltransferase [Enterovibrio norvegicus]SFP18337.1 Glycosyltransferase involved in cell wall bisynthesis [Enterovibrio norvegicus DSM 15893]
MQQRKNILFLGFSIPKKLTESINKSGAGFTIQTHKYSWALLKALASNGCVSDLLSVPQVLDYPKAKFAYSKGAFAEESLNGTYIPFINVTLFKHLTRMLNSLFMVCAKLKSKKFDCLFVYGLHSPFLIAANIAKYIFKLPLIVVVTDPPSLITEYDNKLKTVLKKIDQALIRKLLKRFDGAVVLSEQIANEYLKGKPYVVVEGIYNSGYSMDLPEKDEVREPVAFTYAGSLDKESGIGTLLDAFKRVGSDNVILNICGAGAHSKICQQEADKYNNINFLGLLDHKRLTNLMSNTDVMINVRNPADDFTKYSFPSKITEILGSGLPLLSTKLSSIPIDYDEYIYYIDRYSEEGIAEVIEKILNSDKTELRDKGQRAKRFIRDSKCEKAQGKIVSDFIEKVCIENV